MVLDGRAASRTAGKPMMKSGPNQAPYLLGNIGKIPLFRDENTAFPLFTFGDLLNYKANLEEVFSNAPN
jgi:hypothetical protein